MNSPRLGRASTGFVEPAADLLEAGGPQALFGLLGARRSSDRLHALEVGANGAPRRRPRDRRREARDVALSAALGVASGPRAAERRVKARGRGASWSGIQWKTAFEKTSVDRLASRSRSSRSETRWSCVLAEVAAPRPRRPSPPSRRPRSRRPRGSRSSSASVTRPRAAAGVEHRLVAAQRRAARSPPRAQRELRVARPVVGLGVPLGGRVERS